MRDAAGRAGQAARRREDAGEGRERDGVEHREFELEQARETDGSISILQGFFLIHKLSSFFLLRARLEPNLGLVSRASLIQSVPFHFQVGFITYDRNVHFYSMPDGASQPTQLTVSDIDGEEGKK